MTLSFYDCGLGPEIDMAKTKATESEKIRLNLVVNHHVTFFINSLCHTIGRQPYSRRCSARDSTIMAFLARATLGLGAIAGAAFALPLYDWYRKAELSADRAATLCVQDKEVPFTVFMKLAGGASQLYEDMDRAEFMRQIREYEDADEATLNRVYKFFITVLRTHPFPIMRAKHLDAWIRSDDYSKVTGL